MDLKLISNAEEVHKAARLVVFKTGCNNGSQVPNTGSLVGLAAPHIIERKIIK
jgi:hypothetical protein